MQPSLFPEDDRPAQAARLAPMLKTLAEQGIYFGTQLVEAYDRLAGLDLHARASTRRGGKFSRRKFEQEKSLAGVCRKPSPAVGGDFSFYQFPGCRNTGGGFLLKPHRNRCVSATKCRKRSPSRAGRATRGTDPEPAKPIGRFWITVCSRPRFCYPWNLTAIAARSRR